MNEEFITKSTKEFKWNRLAHRDYMYFLSARTNCFIQTFYHVSDEEINCMFPCIKENGDINAIYSKAISIGDPIIASKEFRRCFDIMASSVKSDMFMGNIGKYVYFLERKKGYWEFRKIEIDMLQEKKKIISKLEDYRNGDMTTPQNMEFNDMLELTRMLKPRVIYSISPFKKQEMLQGKFRDFREELECKKEKKS